MVASRKDSVSVRRRDFTETPASALLQAGLAEVWNEQVLGTLATGKEDSNGHPFYFPIPFRPRTSRSPPPLSLRCPLRCAGPGWWTASSTTTMPAPTTRCSRRLPTTTCGIGSHGSMHAWRHLPDPGPGRRAEEDLRPDRSTRMANGLYSNWFWDAGTWTPPTTPGAGWGFWNVVTAPVLGVNTRRSISRWELGAVPMIFQTPPVVTPVGRPAGQEAFVFHFQFRYRRAENLHRDQGLPRKLDGLHGRGVEPDLSSFNSAMAASSISVSPPLNDGILLGELPSRAGIGK